MQNSYLKKIKFPNKPGVYFFKKGKDILYIGKATSLSNRVKSYFSRDLINTRGRLLVDMVFQADNISWQETDSVLEALILEARLIKQHLPYYNTREKDDKSFNFVCITKEPFPTVLVLRERILKKNLWQETHHIKFQAKYGPFTNGMQLREAMKIIRRIFPYIDAQSAKRDNAAFYRQLGLSPEVGSQEAKIAYDKNIKNLKMFFEGKKKRVITNFRKEMMLYAKKREFERAEEMKKRIFALTHINDIALLKNEKKPASGAFRIEAYDIAHMSGKNMVGTMVAVEDGEASKSEYRKFKIRTQTDTNDTGALTEVLERRLGHREWPYPRLVVLDGGPAQLNAGQKLFKKLGLQIPVVSVVKDERHKPKNILGDEELGQKYKKEIILANSEAHRFSINYHKNLRGRNFLK